MENKSFILLFCLLLCGCGLREQKSQAILPIAVEVQTMVEQTSVSRHTYVGQVEERSSVSLSALTAGRVLAIYAERGARVQAGDVLICIDSTQAVNARRSAEAVVRQAEDGFARAYVLYKEGGITEQKYVEIESQLMQARTMYASAMRIVEECRITAPVGGVISDCQVRVGENVTPGIPIIHIIDIDEFIVRFSVPESEIANIRIGANAKMVAPAIQSQELSMVVTEKSLLPNKLAHSYEVVATLCDQAELLPGMMAKVTLARDVMTGFILPQNCIQMLPDGAKVWVAEENTAVRKNVQIGQYVQNGVLVVQGIQTGDKVITKGYQKLWQGAEITY